MSEGGGDVDLMKQITDLEGENIKLRRYKGMIDEVKEMLYRYGETGDTGAGAVGDRVEDRAVEDVYPDSEATTATTAAEVQRRCGDKVVP